MTSSKRNQRAHRLTVGFVGPVVPIKDVDTLIEAAALTCRELPLELVIVGPLEHDPGYVAHCQALVRGRALDETVSFVGERDPSPWYHRFDAVAVTARSEPDPPVLLDAMAAGLPTVATRVGGSEELLAGPLRGRRVALAGLLVPPHDPSATAEALVILGQDRELRRRLGAAARERARQHHRPAQVWRAFRSPHETAAA